MLDIFSNVNSWIFIFGIGLIFIELLLGAALGFELFVIGLIFILSSIFGWSFNNLYLTLVFIGVLSTLYFIYGRKRLVSKLKISTHNSNIDTLIGQTGIVVKPIKKDSFGQVKVGGETWRAKSKSNVIISDNTKVKIISVSGVTLHVETLPNK